MGAGGLNSSPNDYVEIIFLVEPHICHLSLFNMNQEAGLDCQTGQDSTSDSQTESTVQEWWLREGSSRMRSESVSQTDRGLVLRGCQLTLGQGLLRVFGDSEPQTLSPW